MSFSAAGIGPVVRGRVPVAAGWKSMSRPVIPLPLHSCQKHRPSCRPVIPGAQTVIRLRMFPEQATIPRNPQEPPGLYMFRQLAASRDSLLLVEATTATLVTSNTIRSAGFPFIPYFSAFATYCGEAHRRR